jgi:hypothetical protein
MSRNGSCSSITSAPFGGLTLASLVAVAVPVVVPPDVQALRASQEMVAIYQFLLIFDKPMGVKVDDKTPEVCRRSPVTPPPAPPHRLPPLGPSLAIVRSFAGNAAVSSQPSGPLL